MQPQKKGSTAELPALTEIESLPSYCSAKFGAQSPRIQAGSTGPSVTSSVSHQEPFTGGDTACQARTEEEDGAEVMLLAGGSSSEANPKC